MEREGSRLERDDLDRLPQDPSREEIAAMCEQLRKGWSPKRLAVREGFARWRLQSVPCQFFSDGKCSPIE